ncbi:malate synthase A [Rhodomicrobium sp.]|uniref:malate synthase A n=1 Tax=Rhodomicrobium sp. TaxID=2720632 RepID=UPI0039E2CEE7
MPAAPILHLALPEGMKIAGPIERGYDRVLTAPALEFIAELHRRFEPRRHELMQARGARQAAWDSGALPDFLPETKKIREVDWTIAAIPDDLTDRRVEITGPTTRKMIVNALNSGAKAFMADCEDSLSPTWANVVEGQINLADYWRGEIDFTEEDTGKSYAVGPNPAVLIVRPRGWHLVERHVTVDKQPVAGALFDFGLYFFHNANAALAKGSGPYFYLPKMESHLEARLWNEVFLFAEEHLQLRVGTIKATVLIETLPAVFEMHEILYELRDHIVGLNCGRWDYIFSYIKTLRTKADRILPDRGQVVMSKAFLKAYAELLIQTCHRRGAFAMGGMSAFIPNRRDPDVNEKALAAVREDKLREVTYGHDGTWVAHPDLVPVALAVFDEHMPQKNQLSRLREDVAIGQAELLQPHDGTRTEEGLRVNTRVGIQYIEAWLRGNGAVPLYNLMEDAATAEISRTQNWQWLHHGAKLEDGRKVTPELIEEIISDEMLKLHEKLGADFDNGRFQEAIVLFRDLVISGELNAFLTLPAYKLIE